MPAAIPIIVYAVATAAELSALYVGIAVAVAGVVAGLIQQSMMKAPRQTAGDLEGRQRIIRSATAPRRVIYGEVAVSGVLAFAASTGGDDDYLHLVIVLASHQVEAITDVYLNDRLFDEDHPAWGYARINKHLGSPAQAADADLVAEVAEWTENHKLSEMAYIYARLWWKKPDLYDPDAVAGYDIWPTGIPNIKAVVKGKNDIYDPRYASTGYTKNWALCVNDYLKSQYGLACTDSEVDEDMIIAAANVSDEDMEPGGLVDLDSLTYDWDFSGANQNGFFGVSGCVLTPLAEYLQAYTPASSSYVKTPTGLGVDGTQERYLRMTLRRPPEGATWNGHVYFNSATYGWQGAVKVIPEIPDDNQPHTIELDMWSLDQTPIQIEWSADSDISHLALLFYSDPGNIYIDSIQIGDRELFKRYVVNGSFDVASDPAAIIEDLLTAAQGSLTYSQGKHKLRAAAYEIPVGSLDEDDLRGPIKVRPRKPKSELVNVVRGQFVSPEDSWQPVEFPQVANDLYVTQDGGEETAIEILLPYTTDAVRAQILAKLVLERARQSVVVEFPAKFSGMLYLPGDTIQLSVDQLGWVDKEFLVVGWTVAQDGGGVDLVLHEEAVEIYDWNDGLATRYDPAPDTNLPDPYEVGLPTALQAESGNDHLGVAADGTIFARVLFSWIPPASGFVIRYEVGYKKSGESVWFNSTSVDQQIYIGPAAAGDVYDLRVRAVNALGAKSSWVYLLNHGVVGKEQAPPAVTTFTVERQGDGTREFRATYTNKPADHAGYRIYYKLGTGHVLPNMTLMNTDGLITSFPFESNQLAAGGYTFAITAVDTSGLESEGLYIETTLADPRLGNVAYSEYPASSGWPGVKTDCAVNSNGFLEALSDTTWASAPATWAEFEQWNDGARSPIVYEHPEIDLGFDVTFTPLISMIGNGNPTITMQWKPDGGVYNGSWVSPLPVTARYLKVRVSVAGDYPLIQSLPILFSAETITEEINDRDTSALTGAYRIGTGDVRLPITKPYTQISQVQIALQSVGAGWTWVLIDKDVSVGPRIRIYNASGTLSDATIDAFIRGL